MHRISYSFALFLFLLVKLSGQMHHQLHTDWFFSPADSIQWLPCNIPGNSFTALLENSKIPDPYFSQNEASVQWVSQKEWLFKSLIQIEPAFLLNEHIYLNCPGLDTYCKVYLNDEFIGNAENAFRTWNFDIKSALKAGTNELLIKFQSASQLADSMYRQLETKLPGEKRVMVRKPQYQFGWDFGPTLESSGITKPISIIAWNEYLLEHVSLHTKEIGSDYAELKLEMDFNSGIDKLQSFELEIGNQLFNFDCSSQFGQNHCTQNLIINNPQLWWPNGHGNQTLYSCKLSILEGGQKRLLKEWKTGIRTITLTNEADQFGSSFYFLVNGKRIFCKGANYIPQDILFLKSDDPLRIIDQAVDCNFNMLRIWGGGTYESEEFYEACDEKGIMIWQDFMFACGMYPGDSSYLTNVALEAEEQVKRLSSHACIALWCGNNENNEGWNRWGWQLLISPTNQDRIWNDYQLLFNKILPEAVKKHSNFTSYWESSPLYGRGDKRFTNYGDAHDWGLWHDEMPFEELEERVPRFMSEFGFQSLPSLVTLKTIADDSDLQLESKSILNHQKHPRGNKLIRKYISRDFPEPKNFEELIYLNQICQAEGICKIIRKHRLSKPYCMGTLYWQFNDCWPGISWSGIDYTGRYKALQHLVKKTFEPLLFVAAPNENGVSIHALSDLVENESFELDIHLQDFSGNFIFYDHWEGLIIKDSSQLVLTIPLDLKKLEFTKDYYLLLKWKNKTQSGSSTCFFDKYKDLNLLEPTVQILDFKKTNQGYRFNIRAKNFAKSIYLVETESTQFFPNYFDLNPNELLNIECISEDPKLESQDIQFFSLYNLLRN